MQRLRVLFSGAAGKMGRALLPGLQAAPDLEIVAETGRADDLRAVARRVSAQVVIDFSTAGAALGNARAILDAGC